MGWTNDQKDSHVMVLEDSIQCGENSRCQTLSMGLFQCTVWFPRNIKSIHVWNQSTWNYTRSGKCSVANAVSPVLGRQNKLDSFRSQGTATPYFPIKKLAIQLASSETLCHMVFPVTQEVPQELKGQRGFVHPSSFVLTHWPSCLLSAEAAVTFCVNTEMMSVFYAHLRTP